MRIAVIGVGGVGGLLGAMLARGGNEVRFIARGAALKAIVDDGLRVRGPDGELPPIHLAASEDPAALGEVDVVLVAVKTWQIEEVAPRLRPLAAKGLVIPMQNGVEAADRLASQLGTERVAGGLCHMLSWAEGPGKIRWIGSPPAVTLGARHASQTSVVEAFAAALRGGSVRVEVAERIDPALWMKLLFIGPLGAVGAVERAPVGSLRKDARARAQLEASMHEVVAVAAARGVKLADDVVERAMHRMDGLPEDATASMQRDILAGRPSEVHELIGAIVRLGREAHVPTPVSAELYGALVPLEERARAHQTQAR